MIGEEVFTKYYFVRICTYGLLVKYLRRKLHLAFSPHLRGGCNDSRVICKHTFTKARDVLQSITSGNKPTNASPKAASLMKFLRDSFVSKKYNFTENKFEITFEREDSCRQSLN